MLSVCGQVAQRSTHKAHCFILGGDIPTIRYESSRLYMVPFLFSSPKIFYSLVLLYLTVWVRGGYIKSDSVCIYGCTRCVDACTPRFLLLLVSSLCYAFFNLPMYLIQDISGLLCMSCRVESPSGSVLRSMG